MMALLVQCYIDYITAKYNCKASVRQGNLYGHLVATIWLKNIFEVLINDFFNKLNL